MKGRILKFLIITFAMMTVIHVPCSARNVVSKVLDIQELGRDIRIEVNAHPNKEVPIVILYPDKQLPQTDEYTEVKNSVAYVCQIHTDANGYGEVLYTPNKQDGEYTVNAYGAIKEINFSVVAEKPFYAMSWDNTCTPTRNIQQMYRVYMGGNSNGQPTIFGSDPEQDCLEIVAQRAKTFLDTLPEGRRFLFITNEQYERDNFIWFNNLSDITKKMDEFFEYFKSIGGQVDYIVQDWETYLTIWEKFHGQDGVPGLTESDLKSITSDVRFERDIIPLLEERGFTGLPEVKFNRISHSGVINGLIWNRVMYNRVVEMLEETIYQPAKKYFPHVQYSNYGSVNDSWMKVSDANGYKTYLSGNKIVPGTHVAPSLYGWNWNLQVYTADNDLLEGYRDYPYEKTPFHGLLAVQNNYLRASLLSNKDKKLQPWIANYDWHMTEIDTDTGAKVPIASSFAESPYYYENILHTGLCNPDPFLYWGPYYSGLTNNPNLQIQLNIFSDVLDELNDVAGFSDRYTLVNDLQSWNDHYLLSGMYAGGRNIWRITPDITKVSVADFCVSEETPTFYVDGRTIVFPEGKIYTSINQVSEYGYWVETPADVFPIVTTAEEKLTGKFDINIEVYKNASGMIPFPIDAENIYGSQGITYRLRYDNYSKQTEDMIVLLAKYDGQQNLLDVEVVSEKTVQPGEEGVIIHETACFDTNVSLVKFFVWDGLDKISPLEKAAEFNVSKNDL